MNRDLLLFLLSVALVAVAVAAALPSFRTTKSARSPFVAAIGDPLAAGIFLGAGLIHMLPEAAEGYMAREVNYPWPFVICGATAVALASLERVGSDSGSAAALPLVAVAALAAHSFLAGAALGVTSRETAVLILFLALLAHKGAASFSLAQLLARSALSRRLALIVQGLFIVALPIGVALGEAATRQQQAWPLAKPTILALGAGTFLHFGMGHRRRSSTKSENTFWWWAPWCGFLLMALIAAIG